MKSVSGKDVIASTTRSESCWVAASDASGEPSKKRLTWLWSSTGASSRRDCWKSGTAPTVTRAAATTIPARMPRAPSSRRT